MNGELAILLRHLAAVQQRIDRQLRMQQQEIASLQGALMMSRAALVLGVTRGNWLATDKPSTGSHASRAASTLTPEVSNAPHSIAANARNNISLLAAEVVICRTGCLSHEAYWRVQEYCLRHGKRCLLLESDDEASLLPLPALSTS